MKKVFFVTASLASLGFVGALLTWNASQTSPSLESQYQAEVAEFRAQILANHTPDPKPETTPAPAPAYDDEDSYSDFLARREQRKADLKYCAKNRGDWSCYEGQYAGQY